MSERRSVRSKKEVDYSKFQGEDGAFGSDDDFAEPTPPPSKRTKLSKDSKKDGKKSQKRKEKVADEEKKGIDREQRRKKRQSADERMYERELELAMQISMIDSQGVEPSDSDSQGMGSTEVTVVADVTPTVKRLEDSSEGDNKENQQVDEPAPPLSPVPTKTEQSNVRMAPPLLKPRPTQNEDPDVIEVLEENVPSPIAKGGRQRRAASKATNKMRVVIDSDGEAESDDGEEFCLDDDEPSEDDLDEDSDDDYDVNNDSDFEGSKAKSKKKAKRKTPQKASKKMTTSTPVQKPAASKTVSRKPKNTASVSAKVSTKTAAKPVSIAVTSTGKPMSSPGLGVRRSVGPSQPAGTPPAGLGRGGMALAAARRPVWTPPGQATGTKPKVTGISSQSPGGGVLRLGLSRNVRVCKPLHASVKAPH